MADIGAEVRIIEKEDTLSITMPEELKVKLNRIVKLHGMENLEDAVQYYIKWIVEKPEEFKNWISDKR